MTDEPRYAPDGWLWVCHACGKTAKDRYGGPESTYMWDESCMMNSGLHPKKLLVMSEGGRVVEIKGDEK